MPFAATWMDPEIVILSEVSQAEKEKYRMILVICGILAKGREVIYVESKKMIQMNLFTNKT